eukprot:m.209722 g.209722  ORF g.209722 m.209722 type:complete len:62 (-) comp22100_c0_seq17:19-204(-)
MDVILSDELRCLRDQELDIYVSKFEEAVQVEERLQRMEQHRLEEQRLLAEQERFGPDNGDT